MPFLLALIIKNAGAKWRAYCGVSSKISSNPHEVNFCGSLCTCECLQLERILELFSLPVKRYAPVLPCNEDKQGH